MDFRHLPLLCGLTITFSMALSAQVSDSLADRIYQLRNEITAQDLMVQGFSFQFEEGLGKEFVPGEPPALEEYSLQEAGKVRFFSAPEAGSLKYFEDYIPEDRFPVVLINKEKLLATFQYANAYVEKSRLLEKKVASYQSLDSTLVQKEQEYQRILTLKDREIQVYHETIDQLRVANDQYNQLLAESNDMLMKQEKRKTLKKVLNYTVGALLGLSVGLVIAAAN